MITCFLSAQPPYRGLSGCPLLPTGCPQTPPMDQPFPDTSPLSPVTAEVTLMVLISPTDIHSLVYPSAYLLPPPPGAEGSTTFSPRLPQTSKWHHSASGGSGQKPRSQSRCFSSHHHPSAAPLVPTQSCQLFLQHTSQFIHFLLTSQPPPDCKPSASLAWTIARSSDRPGLTASDSAPTIASHRAAGEMV